MPDPAFGALSALRQSAIATFVALGVSLAPAAAASSQRALSLDTITDAQRLRDAGNLTAAAQVLRALVTRRPDDGEAARLLAQTLYWLKDLKGARAVYESTIARHPQDTATRLQYARMLAETGERARAHDHLMPLLQVPAIGADAATLMGLLAYWDGDYATARGWFTAALQSNPNQEEARRSLQDILTVTAPWIRVSSTGWHDNQPLDRLGLGVEAGWSIRPLTELTARVQPTQYQRDNVMRTITTAEIGVSHHIAPSRIDVELAAGAVWRPDARGSEWTGRAGLGLRLPQHLTVRGRFERRPYLNTRASLDAPVAIQTLTGVVQLDQRGWLGEATYQREHYPDSNVAQAVYGWLLAPLTRGRGLQGGYAFSFSNAESTRFVLRSPLQPYSPDDPRFSTVGHYVPYYTPNHLITHSATGAVTVRTGRAVTVRMDGSYALRATENTPYFIVVNGQVVPSTYLRTFHPWNGRGSLEIKLHDSLTLIPTGEIGHAAFYSWATAGLQLTYRFRPTAPRPASLP